MKKGYTLSEVMVTMAILGLMASILLPTISKFRPNRDKMLFKKAYYVAERVIYELVNDDTYYSVSDGNYFGLDNVEQEAHIGTASYGGKTEAKQKSKFCNLFSKKVNITKDEARCNSGFAEEDLGKGSFTTPSFYTSDGIAWYMPYTNFESDAPIFVDVSGSKTPNCKASDTDCIKPDIFKIIVHRDGKMHVEGDKEVEFLQSNTTTR